MGQGSRSMSLGALRPAETLRPIDQSKTDARALRQVDYGPSPSQQSCFRRLLCEHEITGRRRDERYPTQGQG